MNPRTISRRLAVSVLTVFVLVVAFVIRLVDLQVVRAGELTASADSRRTVEVTIPATRGSILDANGVVLADGVDRFDLTAAPKNVQPETYMTVDGVREKVPTMQVVAELSELTGVPVETISSALFDDPEALHAYIAKGVTLDVYRAVEELGIAWMYVEPHPARTYPNGAIAGNLVGFIGRDGPLAGIELSEQECLAPTNGKATYERSADGVRLPGSTIVETEAVDGGTIHLTIDADLQWYAQLKLAEQAQAIGADWATATVVEVATGRIMAAADWPSIDPNDLNSVPADDAGARSFTAPFEPGSIMKPATFAALLDAGLIDPATRIVVPGRYTEGLPEGEYISDVWAHDDIRMTATGVLMNSSNIGTVILATRMPLEERHAYLEKFGFGRPTDVGFLGEEQNSGTLYEPDEIDPVSALAQQFGQGMTATSAQLASMYQTLGNGGVRMPLTLIDGCELPDGTWTDRPPTDGTRVVSEYAADTTVAMMETVVTQGGLRSSVNVPGYRIAAKTGTAEVAQGGRYGSERIVSVAGLVPAENPQYAIVVTMGKPDTMKTSAGAAPTFDAITEQVVKTFRITPSTKSAPALPLYW